MRCQEAASLRRRVVVTGLGVISSLGFGRKAFGEGLRAGQSGISETTLVDMEGFPSRMGGEVKGFDPRCFMADNEATSLGRSSQFAVAASRLALRDARLDEDHLHGQAVGVIVGTTSGEAGPLDALTYLWQRQGLPSLDTALIRMASTGYIASAVSRVFGLTGEALTIPTACAAGNYAIGAAFDAIASGEAEIVLGGGSDSMCRKTFAGFTRLGIVAKRCCQPFDRDRQGLLPAEGAGILVLESYEHARERAATIYAEVLGYSLNCDATHMVAPNKDSIAACIRAAHARAGVSPEEIDYVSAHGTGTRHNDLSEYLALREVFGRSLPPVSSIKSMLGHTMGAASALAAIACCLAIAEGFIPPTMNYAHADPEIELDCVANHARSGRFEIVQNNAFAFGGNNAILIMARCQKRDR